MLEAFTIFGFKVSIVFAAVIGAIIRVTHYGSTAKTSWGRAFDVLTIGVLSVCLGLMLFNPVMAFFAIEAVHGHVVAMILALVSEIVVTKILDFVKRLNIDKILRKVLPLE